MVASIRYKKINQCFKTIQGRDKLAYEQNKYLQALCLELREMTNIISIASGVDMFAIWQMKCSPKFEWTLCDKCRYSKLFGGAGLLRMLSWRHPTG